MTTTNDEEDRSAATHCSPVCLMEVSADGWNFHKCRRPAKAVMHGSDGDSWLCENHAKIWARDDRLESIK